MFDVSEWLKEALISGVQKGTLAREYVVVKTVDYLARGILADTQVQEIAEQTAPETETGGE